MTRSAAGALRRSRGNSGVATAGRALAIGLAVTGHVNPLVAAILMPVSSLVSLSIVAGGMRNSRVQK